MEAIDWLCSCVATKVERNVRQLLPVQSLATFKRFMRLCAARTGTHNGDIEAVR